MVARKREREIMSEFADGEELLEEIVETTEEPDVDFCSNGDTIDDSSGLPLGEEFIEEVEDLKPLLQLRQEEEDDDEEAQQLQHQHLQLQCKSNGVTSNGHNNNGSTSTSSSSRKRSHSTSSSNNNNNNVQQQVSTVNGSSGSSNGRSFSRNHMEQEKRMRREIANSNERRRMQSINAGFQSLRTLLPHHEGEKLSKAAILQQTAEYIYQLEQQKTQLLSQNLQLKRLVDQHEGAGDVVNSKKRKTNDNQGVVVSLPVHVSESVDEGLGSMSPEPLSVITLPTADNGHVTTAAVAGVSSSSNNNSNGSSSSSSNNNNINDTNELKRQLECERAARAHLEKQLRLLQTQIFPERYREEQQIIAYQPHEVIEHTNNVITQEVDDGITSLQVVSVVAVPSVGSTQTIETSEQDVLNGGTPPLSPQQGCEIIVASNNSDGDSKEIMSAQDLLVESRPNSPKILGFTFATTSSSTSSDNDQQQQQITSNGSSVSNAYTTTTTPLLASGATVTNLQDFKVSGGGCTGQYITSSPTRPFSPNDAGGVVTMGSSTNVPQRIPSVLEAAMKAEPKVEVERLPSPSNSLDDGTPQARLYLAANTSRQNLETIVEAIRHLEGDHLFGDEPAQDRPLALTNKTISSPKHRLLRAEVSNFLQFSPQQQQQQQLQQQKQQDQKQTQQRPGVIVAKHS